MTKIDQLKKAGAAKGVTLYNVCFRNAGVGIMWYDPYRPGVFNDFQKGLVVYHYYDNLKKAIKAELKRLAEQEQDDDTGTTS